MEMVFLVYWLNQAMVVMPKEYTMNECLEIKDKMGGFSKGVVCIPTPKIGKLEQFKNKYEDCKMEGMMIICPPIYRPN